MSLIYAAPSEADILCKEELAYLASTRANLRVHFTLENPPPQWNQSAGRVSEAILRAHLPPPDEGVMVRVNSYTCTSRKVHLSRA